MPRKAAPPDLATQGGRLMHARLKAGVATRPEAAEIFSMPKATYESHENGNRAAKGIPIDYAVRYAKRFKVSLAWLLANEGEPAYSTTVEVCGFIGAGAEIEDLESSTRFEELGIMIADPDEIEWFEVIGRSMEPVVFPGDFAAFSKRQYQPNDLLRQACLVYLDDGKRYFKKLNPGSNPGLYDLISYNDADRPDERVLKVGRLAMIVAGSRRA